MPQIHFVMTTAASNSTRVAPSKLEFRVRIPLVIMIIMCPCFSILCSVLCRKRIVDRVIISELPGFEPRCYFTLKMINATFDETLKVPQQRTRLRQKT
jgi:hypothetical protein